MLEEAVAEVKGEDDVIDTGWSPQISVETSLMMRESYVPDLHLRMGLYRRALGELTDLNEIDGFGAGNDRSFRTAAEEILYLLKIVTSSRSAGPPMSRNWMPARRVSSCSSAAKVSEPGGTRWLHRQAGLDGKDQARP